MKRTACTLALVLLIAAASVHAREQAPDDSLAAARGLYAEASYEDALAMLDRLESSIAPGEREQQRDVQLTRALCFVALNREADARTAMEAVVNLDPTFDLDPSQAAPRVRDLMRSVRAQRLPIVIRERYASAKQVFDDKNYEQASKRFAEVRALLDDPVLDSASASAGLDDLRTLTAGFSDLSLKLQGLPPPAPRPASSTPPPPPAATGAVAATGTGAAPAPVGTSGSTVAQPGDAGDGTAALSPARVVAPVAIEQQAPAWSATLGLARGRTYKATVRVVIDETGKVTSASILESVNRIYDQSLLDAVRRWRYQPGTRDGVPIPFTKIVTVTVEARDPALNR